MALSTISKTVNDVANNIRRSFGDESGVQISDADIIRWVNNGQLEICSSAIVKRANSTTNLVAGQSEYDLSSLKIHKINSLRVSGTKAEYLTFQDFDEKVQTQDPSSYNTGTPYLWTEWAGKILLYPTPSVDQVNGISVFYIPLPDDVTSMSDTLYVPDIYFNRLVEFVLAQAYELDDDPENSQFKLSQFSSRLSSMGDDDTDPSIDFYPVITVDPEDEWYM